MILINWSRARHSYFWSKYLILISAVYPIGAAFGQPDRTAGAYGQSAYGAYGSMLQQAGYAGAPGAAASPYGTGYGNVFPFIYVTVSFYPRLSDDGITNCLLFRRRNFPDCLSLKLLSMYFNFCNIGNGL